MQTIRVLAVPGTWDFAPGMLGGVTRHLDTSKFDITFIKYPQTFALPVSYARSKKIAIDRLREEWERDLKAPIVLLGYSQGADAAGDFALEIAGHPRLKGVALVADPRKPRGPGVGHYKLQGHGICGERPIPHTRVIQAAIPGDVVCDAHRASLWRLMADLTQVAGLNVPRWAVDVARTALRADVQLLQDIGTAQRLWGMLSTLPELAFYVGGLHSSYGTRKCPGKQHSYLVEVAHRISRL
ncbi:MAG TPA: hypothetical protein GX530_03095 [Corynebacteriales bacterium]|nr:hypothetical protein [Mycobacteriales bacterium]